MSLVPFDYQPESWQKPPAEIVLAKGPASNSYLTEKLLWKSCPRTLPHQAVVSTKIPKNIKIQKFEEECRAAANQLALLPEDWDEEGAQQISQATIDRAVTCLLNHTSLIGLTKPPCPTISPCSDGSIDLHWEGPPGSLLLNVPSSSEKRVTFSWIGMDEQRAKGSFKADQINSGVAAWLCKLAGR